MEWSIQQVSRITGATSRALRHYDQVGLLPPSRIGHGGLRYYDEDALVRLQRILLLRELGLGIPAIVEALSGSAAHGDGGADADEPIEGGSRAAGAGPATDPEVAALRIHLVQLRREQELLARRIDAVAHTIDARERGEPLMAEDMFDGFDHTQHREEVERRWGRKAYADSSAWWESKSAEEKKEWQARQAALAADWAAAAERGVDPASEAAQALAARHVDWLAGIPGTPGYPAGPSAEYLAGLGEMYVADPRFAANYGGRRGAEFVRDALAIYAAAMRGERSAD
ncbi:TipAS antibiotic-recognition domain-containing protein [Schumannella luteola]|nr:MerR family transcriptional regulator [Schumannella luteola]TPX05810.1 MerR family transcriptional regulator [Schumannella luteola]